MIKPAAIYPLVVALCCTVACARCVPEDATADKIIVPSEDLCVTSGQVRATGVIDGPSVRAVVPVSRGDDAAVRFIYTGLTDQTRALASGQLRRQLGLKLRAADSCNVVYAMWRIERESSRIEVSVKRNPGEHLHAQCGNRGYTKIRASYESVLPLPEEGKAYALRAWIVRQRLMVSVNGEIVWRGNIDKAASEMRGPAGVRTDNVALKDVAMEVSAGDSEGDVVLPARCRR